MNHITNVSEDHPLWASQEYNKDEYEKQLSKINKASDNSKNVMYVNEKHAIELYDVSTLRGKVIHVFYRIIGSLGFQNPFDTVKVNYELLRLLRYGVSQHFFNEKTTQGLAENLKAHLTSQKRAHVDQAIIDVIADILTRATDENGTPASATPIMRDLTATIQAYYQTHLPKLFHTQTQAFVQDANTVKYNRGCILAATDAAQAIREISNAIEESLSESLEDGVSTILKNKENQGFDKHEFQRSNNNKCETSILKAINENPRKIAWVFQLFQIYTQRIDELIKSREFETADLLCDQLYWLHFGCTHYVENKLARDMIRQFYGEEQEILSTVANAYHAMGKISLEKQQYPAAARYLKEANWYTDRMTEKPNSVEWSLELCEVRLKLAAQLQKEGNPTESAQQYRDISLTLANITDWMLYGGPAIIEALHRKDYKTISEHFERLHKQFEPFTARSKQKKKDFSPAAIEKRLLTLIEMQQKVNQARFLHVQKTVSNCGYEAVKQLWEQGAAEIVSEETSDKNDQFYLQIYNSILTQQLSEGNQDKAIVTFKEAMGIIYTGWTSNFKACRALLEIDPASELSKEQQKSFYGALRDESNRVRILLNMAKDFDTKLEDIEPKTVEMVITKQKHLIRDLLINTSSNIPSKTNEDYISKVVDLLIREGFYVSPSEDLTNDRIYGCATFAYELWNKDGSERTLESIEEEVHTDFENTKSNPRYYVSKQLPEHEVINFSEVAEHCNISIEEQLKHRVEFFCRRSKETKIKDLIVSINGNLVKINNETILNFDISSKLNINVSLIEGRIVMLVSNSDNKHLKVIVDNYPWARAKGNCRF